MKNTTGITPLEYKVLVRPDEAETKTKGGIILADTSVSDKQLAETRGVVVAISPLAFTYADWPDGYQLPTVGDRIVMGPYVGVRVNGKDGGEYRMINDKDVIGVER